MISNENLEQVKLSRRGFTKAALGLVMSGALSNQAEVLASGDSDSNDEVAELGDVKPFAILTNPNLNKGRENYDLNMYREWAENSPEDFGEFFTLTSEKVPEPELFQYVFPGLFGVSLGLGCTAADAEPFFSYDENGQVKVDAEGYFRAMDDKYTYPVYSKLFREGPQEILEGSQTHTTYTRFRQARHAMGLHFLRHVYKTHTADDVPVVTMTSCEDPSVKGTGYYGVRVGLHITNDLGDNDLTKDIYEVEGVISVGVTPTEEGRLDIGLAVHQPWDEFYNEIAAINE